jgi:hypothetical protein
MGRLSQTNKLVGADRAPYLTDGYLSCAEAMKKAMKKVLKKSRKNS